MDLSNCSRRTNRLQIGWFQLLLSATCRWETDRYNRICLQRRKRKSGCLDRVASYLDISDMITTTSRLLGNTPFGEKDTNDMDTGNTSIWTVSFSCYTILVFVIHLTCI